jgi:dGTP triphosphohydrolase
MVDINIDMTPLKKAIFVEVRKTHPESNSLDDIQLNKLLFHHPDGLRLSLKGFLVVKHIFTAYSFEMPETIKSKHQRSMAKLEYPYYFTKSNSRLILFSEMDAMVIKLHGGVQSFLEAFCYVDD